MTTNVNEKIKKLSPKKRDRILKKSVLYRLESILEDMQSQSKAMAEMSTKLNTFSVLLLKYFTKPKTGTK